MSHVAPSAHHAESDEVSFAQGTVFTHDGYELATYQWTPHDKARAHVLILHGYAEYCDRYRHVAHRFAQDGIGTLGVDLRGHGKSKGRRGYVRSFADYDGDVTAALSLHDGKTPLFVLGHSAGGLLALDLLCRSQLPVEGLVLTNPFVGFRLEVPAYKRLIGNTLGHLLPWMALPSGVDPSSLSHNTQRNEAYDRDPLIFSHATSGWFVSVQEAQKRVMQLEGISMPFLYIYSGSDPIASGKANAALAAKLSCRDKTVLEKPGQLHELLNETKRAETLDKIVSWIVAHLA